MYHNKKIMQQLIKITIIKGNHIINLLSKLRISKLQHVLQPDNS